MKPRLPLFVLFVVLCPAMLHTQTQDEAINWDSDLFLEELPEEPPEDNKTQIDLLENRLTVEASYDFLSGFSPGWAEAPWLDRKNEFSYVLGAKINALLGVNFQLADNLRMKNSFSFSIPDNTVFSLKEFYFDYNLNMIIFLRAGIYEIAWGISRYFPYTNLPARIPSKSSGGQSYLAKLEAPVSIGGLQLLAMTRPGFLSDSSSPSLDEFGYGIKYNVAFPAMDIDMGFFYHKEMPLRSFASLKTTIVNTELYVEGLAATPYEKWNRVYLSGSAGFIQDFFNGRLTLSGEIFYNGEHNAIWYQANTEAWNEEANPLIEGLNAALVFIIRPGILGMRIFCRAFYSLEENSAQLIPGISIKPGDVFTFAITVPMVLGSPDGIYYRYNTDIGTIKRPFNIMIGLSFSNRFVYGN